ncbi:MAG TPA: hypothetical protein DCM87_13195 [Planctomycetes bacterium]|nr:hypothetical protein [Planctomycetota bacterium]
MPDSNNNPASREGAGPSFEDLLARYIDRLNDGERIDPALIRAEHPELGDKLLQDLEAFVDLSRAHEEVLAARTLGDYTLRRRIGRGGMGIVYDAWQTSMDRRVALKVLPPGVAADERALQRFVREAKTAGQLNHQNIVGVYGLGVEANTPYYAMEFVDGETLAQILRRLREAPAGAPTPFGAPANDLAFHAGLARAFADVADGLQHAHAKGIVHRDIKPSNLILDREGRLRILDFGLARLEGQESITVSGDLVGTVQYMSPEQAQVRKIAVDHRTDIYSLGATLYEMLALRPPFKGKDHHDTLSQIVTRDAEPLRRLNPRVPRDLETIVLKCLRKEPRDRYGTAEALAQDLRRFSRGDAIEARPQSSLEKLTRTAWRLRIRIVFVSVAALAVLVGAVLCGRIIAETTARNEREYDRLVIEALEGLPLDRLETLPKESAVGEEQREQQGLLASFRILDEKRLDAQVRKSVDNLERAARLVARRPEARYHLVRALRLLGDDERAAEELSRLAARHPDFAPGLVLQQIVSPAASAGRSAGGSSEALASGWGSAWRAAASAIAAREWRQAEAAYSEIMRTVSGRDPFLGADLEVLLARGIARLEARSFEGAKLDFYTAGLRWPRAVLPALLLGKAYLLAGQPADADAWLSAAHAGLADSRQSNAFAVQALQMFAAVDARDLLVPWVERIEPGRGRELARMHALLWRQRGDESRSARKVIEIGEALLREEPQDALIHALVAVAAAEVVGEAHRCEEHTKKAQALAQGDPHVLTLVASVCAPEPAAELCRKILEKDPGFTPARFLLAESLLNAQQPEQAIPILEEMARRNREPARALLLLGHACYLRHRDTEALAHYREALRWRPDWPSALRRIAQIHWRRVEFGEVERIYLSLLRESPDHRNQYMLACLYQAMGRVRESIALLCLALPRFAQPPVIGHWVFSQTLVAEEAADGHEALESFLDTFQGQLAEWPDSPWVLQSMALALARAPGRKDISRALDLARKAVEKSGRKDARFLAGLAAVQFAAGQAGTGIRTLEESSEREFFDKGHSGLLEKMRAALWPRVASTASLDASQTSGGIEILYSATVDPSLLAEDEDAAGELRAYIEASRLQASGQFITAAEVFAEIAATSRDPTHATARLVGCLRAAGRNAEASALLRQTLGPERGAHRRFWDLWWSVEVQDLCRDLNLLIDGLPVENVETAKRAGHRDDLHWLLGCLKDGSPLRIDCGSRVDHADPQGRVWSRDRFYVGGWTETGQNREVNPLLQSEEDREEFTGEIHGAPYDRPYRAARHFPRLLPDSGYRIPLPAGRYRVALHFADLRYPHPGRRRFDVFLENEKVLSDYAPNKVGFATVDIHAFATDVSDGFLDLRFKEIALAWREPTISAIEVERAD